MFFRTEIILAVIALCLPEAIISQNAIEKNVQPEFNRYKRMYAMCPPNFVRIGNECYYFSKDQVNWLDAHFECKDRNSRLAELMKFEDRRLRKYLTHGDEIRQDKWIGGNYNWEKHKWQWGYNGKEIKYQSFSQMNTGSNQDLKYHCAVVSPDLKYRWSARPCTERHYYICQHKMPYVSSNNRVRIYQKWNETFPHEMANEVEVIIAEKDGKSERHRYSHIMNNEIPTNIRSPTRRRPPMRRRTKKPEQQTTFERQRPRNPYASSDLHRRPMVEYAPDPLDTHNGNGYSHRGPIAYIPDPPPQSEVKPTHPHPHRHHDGEFIPVTPKVEELRRPEPAAVITSTIRPTTTTTTTTTRSTTTSSPVQIERRRLEKMKKTKRNQIKTRLSKLSPEEQREFFKLRKERQMKRRQMTNETVSTT